MSATTIANIATVAEAAEICGLDEQAIRFAIHRGDVPGKRVGNRWVVDLTDVEEFAKRPARPREALALELHEEGCSPERIAHVLGIKVRSAKRALNRAGIILGNRRSNYTPEDNQRFADDWNRLKSATAVAAKYGTTAHVVCMRATSLRRKGMDLVRLKRGGKGKRNVSRAKRQAQKASGQHRPQALVHRDRNRPVQGPQPDPRPGPAR